MTREEHEKIIGSIQEKLGNENVGLIADDLGLLVTDNVTMNETIVSKDNEINQLKSDKEKLIMTNGNLFKQIGMGAELPPQPPQPEKIEEFSFKSIFDEKGNFKT